MNSTPRRIAMAPIVFAAFFASGGLKAGTPLAMASTPVRATDPPANALSRRKIESPVPGGNTSAFGVAIGWAWPVTMLDRPIATIRSASPTNR
jgi:hypothetical protein